MVLVKVYEEWERQGARENEWCFKNFLQSRALRQAKNIREQLRDHMGAVRWDQLEAAEQEFSGMKELRKRLKKEEGDLESMLLRAALAQGFYMNAARKVPSLNMKQGD